MMRSWENRADTFVCDEPFYAHYLNETGLDHPGADEVIASQSTDWREVAAWLTGPIPDGATVFYQKHMAHHLLPVMELDWLAELRHALLIREPKEMITSLIDFIPQPTLDDTGLPQQLRLLQHLESIGQAPIVFDSKDVLNDPQQMLGKICDALGLEFQPSMLRWPAGKRETDGVWAKHWYAKVEQTTEFASYRPKNIPVPETSLQVLEECESIYAELHERRLT